MVKIKSEVKTQDSVPLVEKAPKMKKLKKRKINKEKNSDVTQMEVKSENADSKDDVSSNKEEQLRFLRYSVSEKHGCARQLFLKRDLSNENSLLVANVPAYLDTDFVKMFISQFVKVPIIDFVVQRSNSPSGSLQAGQLTCSVVFESSKGVEIALRTCQSVGPYRVADFMEVEPVSTVKASLDAYKSQFSSPAEIQSAVDEYITQQDAAVAQAKREAKRKLTEPDDDGWVTVTKAAKKVGKAVVLKKGEVPLMGGLNKKKKGVDLAFYSFQTKQSKTQKANELRAKFEEDKKRVAMLKNARKFKPL